MTGASPELGEDYVDRFGTDHITLIFWDPTAQGEDELGAVGASLYRSADGGAHYGQGDMPSDPGLFDPVTSVAIFTEIPPAEAPPSYPSPA